MTCPDEAAGSQADVIIRNPTHYVVALRYDANKDGPAVLQGQRRCVEILEIAKHDIPTTENKPPKLLYDTVELNAEVPLNVMLVNLSMGI